MNELHLTEQVRYFVRYSTLVEDFTSPDFDTSRAAHEWVLHSLAGDPLVTNFQVIRVAQASSIRGDKS